MSEDKEHAVDNTVDIEKEQLALAAAQARLVEQHQQQGNELAQPSLQLQHGLADLAAHQAAARAQGFDVPIFREIPREASPQILTLKDKKAICQFREENQSATLSRLIEFVEETTGKKTTHSTVRRVLLKKDQYLSLDNAPDNHQRIRQAKHPELEAALSAWYDQAVQNGESIHSDTLKQKAQELADEMQIPRKNFAASSGWLARFKHRKGFVRKKDGTGHQAQGLQAQEAMHIGLPAGFAELPAQAASFQAQLMDANVATTTDLASAEYGRQIAAVTPVHIVPPVAAEDAHRCAELLASFMEAHPQSFSTEFQLSFQRMCTGKIGQIIIDSTRPLESIPEGEGP